MKDQSYCSCHYETLVLLSYSLFNTETVYYSFKKIWDATFGKDIEKEEEKWAEVLLYSASDKFDWFYSYKFRVCNVFLVIPQHKRFLSHKVALARDSCRSMYQLYTCHKFTGSYFDRNYPKFKGLKYLRVVIGSTAMAFGLSISNFISPPPPPPPPHPHYFAVQ